MECYHKTPLCYATAMKHYQPKHAAPQSAPVDTEQNAPTVARSTALMSVATLSSRVTGLARTFVMGAAVGTTYVSSAYTIANTMPNMLYELVLGGALHHRPAGDAQPARRRIALTVHRYGNDHGIIYLFCVIVPTAK